MRRLGFLGLGALVLVASWKALPARLRPGWRPMRPGGEPTEFWEGEKGDEAAEQEGRERWLASRHAAAPGTDWRRIELQNGHDEMGRRTAAPPPGGAPDDGDLWTERGSNNQAGRTHVSRLGADGTLYVGAGMGGVWRRGSDRVWTPIGDNLYGGVHWLELVPAPDGDPDVLVAATDGGLLHRSVDGGTSWTEGAGLEPAWATRRLTMAHDGSNTLFTVRNYDNDTTAWRSDDAGATWTQIYDFGNFNGDLWVSRTGDSPVWLAASGALLRSDDAGRTWSEVGPLPPADSAELAGTEAADRLWVVQNAHSLLRSDDGGASFAEVAQLEDYWGRLTASTLDPELVVYGGVELHKSADGGSTFGVQNAWSDYYDHERKKLHADIHGVEVIPDGAGGEGWFIDTDGGTFSSDDGLASVDNQSVSGLGVSMYYGTLTSVADPEHIAAGAQDQGYQVNTGQGAEGHVYDFDQLLSGDYAHLTSGDGTHELVYSDYPGFTLIQVGEDEPALTYADFPGDVATHAWLPVLLADPTDPERCFFAGDGLWMYERQDAWTWTASRWSDEDFRHADWDYVSGLAAAPTDPDRMYAITATGHFSASEDQGVTWKETEHGLPGGQYFYGTALVVSALDPDTVYVGGSGYENPPVWVSHDGGRNFTALSDGLPATLVYSLAEEPSSGLLFAGSETSAWRLDPGTTTWQDITGSTAPILVYWSAEVVPALGVVRFGTYGRGIWDYAYDPDLDGCPDGVDTDADGTPCDTDCDDHDSGVAPGVSEVCGDGIDQDCDGADCEVVLPPPAKTPAKQTDDCGCAAGQSPAMYAGIGALLAYRRRASGRAA